MRKLAVLAASIALHGLVSPAKADLLKDWSYFDAYGLGTPSAFDQGGSVEQVYVRGGDNVLLGRIFAGQWQQGWSALGSNFAPGAMPVAANRAVYLRFSDNLIYKRPFISPSAGWGPWELVPNSPAAAKDPVAFEVFGKRYLAVLGQDNVVWTTYPGQTTWTAVGAKLPFAVSQLSVAVDSAVESSVDLVIRGQTGWIYNATNFGNGWQTWRPIHSGFVGDPQAIRHGLSRQIFVFGRRASDNSLGYFTLEKTTRKPSALRNLGRNLQSDAIAFTVTGQELSSLEVFARDASGVIQCSAPTNGQFKPWVQLGGQIRSSLGAACDKLSRQCDLFGFDINGALWNARTIPNQ